MLIRISLILAILAGLAAGTLNFIKVKEKITTLKTNLQNETSARVNAEGERDKNKRDLDQANVELKTTKDSLEAAVAEKAKAEADAAEKVALAAKLQDDIKKLQGDLDSANSQLAAYKNSNLTPEQALNASKTIKQLQEGIEIGKAEMEVLRRQYNRTQAELDRYKGGDKPVELPATASGKIVVSDPKWEFVILDIGEDQGVVPNGEMLVSRKGVLVAKVKVTSVQRNRCVANLIPGWKISEVMEGDQVIPAYLKPS